MGVETDVAKAPSLDEIYSQHHALVYRLALRYGGGRIGWAEDVTHDVFLKLIGALPRLGNTDDLSGWFYRATANLCLNRLRHESLTRSAPVRWLLTALNGTPPTPEAQVLITAELDQVATAIRALPAKERICFCMLHIDGLTQTEIAEQLGLSKGYVCRLLKRADERLRGFRWESADE